MSGSSRPDTPPADPGREPHYYKLGDAARIVGVAPSAIRYWQAEFAAFVRPVRTKAGQHVFSRRDVRALTLIRRLLHEEQRTAREARDRMPALMEAEDRAAAEAEAAEAARQQAEAGAAMDEAPEAPAAAPRRGRSRGTASTQAASDPGPALPFAEAAPARDPAPGDGEATRLSARVQALEAEVRAARDRAEAMALERDAANRRADGQARERDAAGRRADELAAERDAADARRTEAEARLADLQARNESLARELGVMRRRWSVAIDTAGALLRELSDEAGRH